MARTICLDYDGTFTHFPDVCEAIITSARKQGISVILATMRYSHEKDAGLTELEKRLDKVIYTGRAAKKPFLEELGIYPDVWFDDNPLYIVQDA